MVIRYPLKPHLIYVIDELYFYHSLVNVFKASLWLVQYVIVRVKITVLYERLGVCQLATWNKQLYNNVPTHLNIFPAMLNG